MLAEQFALNTTVLWEVFLSDLLMAYVVEEPASYMRNLELRLAQSVRDKFGVEALRCVSIDLPHDIAMSKVAAWLDPKEFNLTFKSAGALQSRANDLLAAQFAKKFSLELDRSQLVNFIVALRNYLAHRSLASRAELKENAAVLSGVNTDLNDRIKTIGSYLKSRLSGGDSRATFLATRISVLAGSLA
jgi:hypothetical protein